jgi:ribose-phosphate pyrophosphokinase
MNESELLVGTAHPTLGVAIARELDIVPLPRSLDPTPDGELLVRVDERVHGRPVTIVQPTAPPVGEHLLELVLLGDACWRLGARSVAAAIPYLGYARHDRRCDAREPLGAKVVANVLAGAHLDRVIVLDPHNAAVEAGFSCPVEMLTAVPVLARSVEPYLSGDSVVVAPDLGATKLAHHYAQILRKPMAIVHKQRLSPHDVVAERVVGDVRGLAPVIVDDMISTAGTVAATVELLIAQGASPPVVVVATHGLFAPPATDRLRSLPLTRVITSDSVPPPVRPPFTHQVVSVAPLLADSIRRG